MSRASRFISRVLRHAPEDVGLTLDAQGWVGVKDLLKGMKGAGHPMSETDLRILVADNDKQRFTLSEDGRRIRAAQGHSVRIDLGLTASCPPDVLYHGTSSQTIGAILSTGILAMKRDMVHLSADTETAMRVGARHGNPVVFSVDARAAHASGLRFYQAENGVWLIHAVPVEFVVLIGRITPEI